MTQLDAQDRMLVERSEEAILEGLDLFHWCFENVESMQRPPLDLGRPFRLSHVSDAILGEARVAGNMMSVMGARQFIPFGRIDGPGAAQRLRQFVREEFLERGHWMNPDGYPGGFGMQRMVYRAGATYGKFTGDAANGAVNWNEIGTKYDWVLLRVQVHDFVLPLGPFKKRLDEAACVVAHPAFAREVVNPSPQYDLEITIGYPFIRFAPIPNFFGFGPGKFHIAVKVFSFFLKPTGEVDCRMYFAAAPRCAKVFDFGPSIPDPVYGSASVLGAITFGAFNVRKFHDKVDCGMLSQHCRVHHMMIEGSEKVFRDWLEGGK